MKTLTRDLFTALITTVLSACLLANLSLAQPAPAAEGATTRWMPDEPMPVDFDWIMLTSGEWLKGEIISMYSDELNFDSDILDELLLDMEDVAIIKSVEDLEVLFDDGTTLVGQVLLQDGEIQVGGTPGERPRESLYSIAQIVDGGFLRLSSWDGELGLTTNIRRGNSEQQDLTIRGNSVRRTVNTRTRLDFLKSRGDVAGIRVENNTRATASLDWFLSTSWFLRPIQLEYFSDEFQNTDERYTYTAAIGYYLLDSDRLSWDVYVGPGYQLTKFNDVAASEGNDEKTAVGSMGTIFEWEITNDIDFDFLYSGQIVSERAGSFNHHAEVGLNIDLFGDFELDLRYILDRIADPVPDSQGNLPVGQDTEIIFGINYDF